MATMDDVRQTRMRAATAHGQLMGNTSACTMSKSGQSFPAGKFWEGRTAALGELLRSGAEDVQATAEQLHRDWRERVVPGNEREAESYRAGGLEALGEFAGAQAR